MCFWTNEKVELTVYLRSSLKDVSVLHWRPVLHGIFFAYPCMCRGLWVQICLFGGVSAQYIFEWQRDVCRTLVRWHGKLNCDCDNNRV